MDDVKHFHEREIAGKAYTYCVVASQKRIRMEDLKKRGEVKVLDPGRDFWLLRLRSPAGAKLEETV